MTETATTPTTYRDLPLSAVIESKWNPRKHFSESTLAELSDSIREKGVIEPILVRPISKNGHGQGVQFEIVAGARRFRASKLAGRDLIPALVRELDDVAALELAVIENQQRDDVHPLDEAEGYQALAKADKKFTPAVIAAKVGKSESYIYKRLKLLQLEAPLKKALAEDRLTVAHAEKLLRLSPDLRAKAAHPEDGVVWSHSPLLDYDEKWIPGAEDLRPLSDLEAFIREKSHFDPAAEDTKHFQPELAVQMESAVDELSMDTDNEQDEQEIRASMIELSEDPLARTRLGAKKGDPIPLTPSKWREVKKANECDHVVKGVITHGGPARILNVCVKRSCQKHFPVAKKKKGSTATARATQPQESFDERWKRQQAERLAAEKVWAAVRPQACALIKAHLAKVKFGAPLLSIVLGDALNELAPLSDIKKAFGLSLTPKTATLILALSTINWDDAEQFAHTVKPWRFDLKPVQKLIAAEEEKAAKAAAKPTNAVDRVVLRALDTFEGGQDRVRAALAKGLSTKEVDQLVREAWGQGGHAGDDCTYETHTGKLVISKPVKKTLTLAQVRPIVLRLLAPARKKGAAA